MATEQTQDQQIAQLQAQQALTIQALRAFLAGNLDGPGSIKWLLAAIDPNGPAPEVAPFDFGR